MEHKTSFCWICADFSSDEARLAISSYGEAGALPRVATSGIGFLSHWLLGCCVAGASWLCSEKVGSR